MMRKLILTVCFFFSASAFSQQQACSALSTWSEGADDLQISEAEYYQQRTLQTPFGPGEVLPAHCHIAGSFERRTGADGKPYAINFAINMPDNWNGRYLFQGGGGMNGSVNEPVAASYAGNQSGLEQGFAVVSNDSGHTSSVFDGSFLRDQQAMLNFQYQANAKVTTLTKPIVESYYQQEAHHSYFLGCSTGGREGMIMAQRFPELYDGIVSGAPAMRTGVSNLALRWVSVELGKAVDNARDPFTDEETAIIIDGLLARCDALDGQTDGMIFNRAACDFDPAALSCSITEGAQCLADEKAQALSRAISGPVTTNGYQVYPSFPWDPGLDDTAGLPGLITGGGNPPEGQHGADMDAQNVAAEFFTASSLEEALGTTGTQYNVNTFINQGGKHIFFHGEADPWFSANETVRYFNEMSAVNDWFSPVEDYARLYLVPGMAHCAGGEITTDQFDMLTPLVNWVENNQAPESIEATGVSVPDQSRPLCPYPGYAHFENGDAALAENYSCRLPE